MNEFAGYDLVIIEWTAIADQNTGVLLPGVVEWFAEHRDLNFAVVTNQGGVAMRNWKPAQTKYPTQNDVEVRLSITNNALSEYKIMYYVSYAFKLRNGDFVPTPAGMENVREWRHDWRMPDTGMLEQAIADAGAETAIMLGRWESNIDAASALQLDYTGFSGLI